MKYNPLMRTLIDTKHLLQMLNSEYGLVKPFLFHESAFQLLVAVILSAQTTDALVNTVTPGLFVRFPDARSLASGSVEEVTELIRRVNYYKNKAKYLIAMAKILVEKYQGEVPQTMEALVQLPGVGRKVANVVTADAFGIAEGVCVDTHVARVSYRVGWTDAKDPLKIERDLMEQWPKEKWVNTPKQVILIGRQYCFANKKPDCEHCPLREQCWKRGVIN